MDYWQRRLQTVQHLCHYWLPVCQSDVVCAVETSIAGCSVLRWCQGSVGAAGRLCVRGCTIQSIADLWVWVWVLVRSYC